MMNSLTLFTAAWLDEATFTNLGTVAFVLMIICSLLGIVCFVRLLGSGAKHEDDVPEPQPASVDAAPAAPAPAPQTDDAALVAVLTAAVAAVLADEAAAAGTTPPAFRVVSFERSSRGRAWNR